MELRTVLLIVLSAVAAITIVFYQYYYKNPRKDSLKFYLAGLRFIAIFCGLLLLVNPKFVSKNYFLEKPNLILLVDDSYSIKEAGSDDTVKETVNRISENVNLRERFSLHQYEFGERLVSKDSLLFDKKNTDITNALTDIAEIFVNSSSAVILVTDGNQTLGKDYQYFNPAHSFSVHPVVVGDTTQYQDLSIGLLNANRYAFLKNKFPIEASISYNGSTPISKRVVVSVNGTPVYRERIELSASNYSFTLNTLIEAKSVGIKTIKVEVEPLDNEKKIINNSKETFVEVIDEKTNVIIVSDMLHPDIGALTKAIESNEQRSVTIAKPSLSTTDLEEADILILYQPNRRFSKVYEYLSNSRTGHFTITGAQTDWTFLNQAQQAYRFQGIGPTEELVPVLNNSFGLFGLSNFEVDAFPPLKGNLGDLEFEGAVESIMFQQIRGVNLDAPLFAVITNGEQREAVLFGENIWKWRAQVFRNDQSFQNFDDFMGKLMLYLTSNSKRSRLNLDFTPVFENAQSANIKAYYFDESYTFDANASLTINMKGQDNEFFREVPMVLKGGFYEVDLSDLEAGEYEFTVTVESENLKSGGRFKILDFNPEKKLLSANFDKLQQLAERTNGKAYIPIEVNALMDELSNAEQYRPVQKSRQNVVSLIDFGILLGIIALSLALEWFIRKYNGLI
ncbi:VWA domain-containing protein [Muricauda sp. JGD-17]|uniref:VWA domain-containing protein n=1 Tax=Flagellimonas ochracea TaxID=2696472 RepID=A0A964TBJ9_9FLAO|nr:VWA domain-containing protein [Allomuricauda ochracea]NAY91008.1 VWA domain-containing protein [Allomuricauda ochracea]